MNRDSTQSLIGIIDARDCSGIEAGRFDLGPGQTNPVEASKPEVQVDGPTFEVKGPRGEAAAPTRFQLLRILLAEDNFVNQRLVCRLLEKRGHTVTVVANGRDVLRQLEQEPFDLVLMDVQMPEMDGVEATAVIRSREQLTGLHLPVVAITAHAMKGDREKYLASGMDAYLPKPIRPQDLWNVIESFPRISRPACQPVPAAMAEQAYAEAPPQSRPRSLALLETAPLNRKAALEQVGGDVSLLSELASLFLENSDSMLARVREAAARGDALALERAAHALKGSVGNFAADEAYQAALDVESYARQGLLAGAAEACERLEQAMVRLRPFVEALLEPVTA